jgi:thiamine biosynthesis lipoprotein
MPHCLTAPMVRLALEAMGTRFELILGPGQEDGARLRAIGEEALAEIVRLDDQLSIYRSSSEVSWINARANVAAVRIEERLFRLIERCVQLSRATDGAFDVTVGPLMSVWGFFDGPGRIPGEDERRRAESSVGWKHLELNSIERTVRFRRPGMRIDFGAIGKGYAIDRAIEILHGHGVTSALLHGGTSSIHAIGAPADADAWHIRWISPVGAERMFALRDRALSVSAVHGKAFEAEGRVFGHVMDPRTGTPTMGARATVVTGPQSLECDAISTALLVLGSDWRGAFGRLFPRYDAVLA